MQMVRLIYVSRMSEECDILAIQQILEVSRKGNRASDITGALCYDPAFFLQCLEGPRTAVNKLYAGIQQDERHRDAVLLEYCEVEQRLFGDWSMAFLKAQDVNREVLEKYTAGRKFDPYSMTSDQARDLLVEIVAIAHDHLPKQGMTGTTISLR